MRIDPHQLDDAWAIETRERDSVTELHERPTIDPWVPTPIAGPRSYPSPIRSYTLDVPVAHVPPLAFARGTGGTPPVIAREVARHLARRRPSVRIGFAVACAVIGAAIGGAIALSGSFSLRAMSPRHVAVRAPMPKPIVASAPLPPTYRHVTVRLESRPAGAQAMWVDAGKTRPIGATPIDIDLDPSREYDLVFVYGTERTTAHVDPRTTHALSVTFASR
jgi:hypothetical protein